jgi:diguanylate cyclase (GGDEF)-like protein
VVGSIYLSSDLRDVKERWRHLLGLIPALLLIALVVGGVSGSLLQQRISGPIRDLAHVMHDITAKQNFDVRVAVSGEDEIAQLGNDFNTMLAELEDRDNETRDVKARLQYQAWNDELTGLPNRRRLISQLDHTLAECERENRALALLYIDLDGFKLVNDSLGHSIGDILLSQVATRLRSRVREADILARMGGDEFAVVLSHVRGGEEAERIAGDFLQVLSGPFSIDDHRIAISASVGISLFPANGANCADLLQQSDCAMYAGKKSGKNRVVLYTSELGTSLDERMSIETHLQGAIDRGEISVHYQPEFDAISHRLIRFEALARWTSPMLGTVSPAKFIPIAEESGVINRLGAYVLEVACREAVRWQSLSPYPIQVAVNVSSVQFDRDDFIAQVLDVLDKTGLKPTLLQIELTESVMLHGTSRSAEMMKRLRKLGISLAIDDFGTGYSCLSHLPKLPFDDLKIDRSFVQDLDVRPETRTMIHSLISLAQKLGMRIIAEGIETKEQMRVVTELGANELQGYLLGRPTPDPAAEIPKLLKEELDLSTSSQVPSPSYQLQSV